MRPLNIHKISENIGPSDIKTILFKGKDKHELNDIEIFNIGIHPWDSNDTQINELEDLIAIHNSKIFALGEIGLDKTKGPDLNIQKECLKTQIELAIKYDIKNILIHSVKAFYELIPFIKEYPINFILHDFNGNEDQIDKIIKFSNTYISLGNNLMRENATVQRFLDKIPSEKIFFETSDKDFSILDIYRRYSFTRKIELPDIISLTHQNFDRIAKQRIFH